ncbi:uncharacterized protein ARMOST_18476 [Armillaria ostoyae]|uniref:Uncharacterized protein n=1 Tax=Armillaria ostoyae TaxID=47428 RepID=A0A284S1X5_ARMOS|nr:uncharacterized protein ARMOST_18476 [Armillaria ostoyae]
MTHRTSDVIIRITVPSPYSSFALRYVRQMNAAVRVYSHTIGGQAPITTYSSSSVIDRAVAMFVEFVLLPPSAPCTSWHLPSA